ncbi:S8 family serine peptidase, partial [Thermodesulfovibrionales bacterium]|nr:S8 family serine peptidase [Thermodesulfovibrionales bacterium]
MSLRNVFCGCCLAFVISIAGAEASAWKVEERENLKGLTYVPGEILVKWKDWADEFSIQQMHLRKGAKVVNTFYATHRKERTIQRVRLKEGQTVEEALRQYRRNPLVAHAQPNYLFRMQTIPDDTRFSELWGLHNTGQAVGGVSGIYDADIDAPEAWGITTGSPDVIIAVIDTGVNYLHPELVGNMWVNPGETPGDGIDNDGNLLIDDIHGWDFFDNDNSPMDFHGHGTHVAGTIAASGNNAAGITGVMWDARIMALKISGVKAFAATSDIVQAINYAVAEGAHIINASWGGYVGTDAPGDALRDAIEAAGIAGVLFVAAAGNDANDNDTIPMFPASYSLDNIISVAATDQHDNLTPWSNYGATSVDVAAPGVSILSTIPTFSYGPPVTLYDSAGFEGDGDTLGDLPSGWVNIANQTGIVNTWAITDTHSKSPPHSFADSPGVNYANNLISTETLTHLATPITYTKDSRYQFTFDVKYDLELGWDFLSAVASADRTSWGFYSWFTGSSDGIFVSRTFDPTFPVELFQTTGAYLGFGIWSDVSVTGKGVYIDNLLLTRKPILINPYDPATSYSFKLGTSMAAPHIAGLAGLLLSHSPHLTVAQLKTLILDGAEDPFVRGLGAKMVSGGRINAHNSLLAIPTVAITSTATDPTNVSPIPMTAIFSETVTGFIATDITVANGIVTAGSFAGTGANYTFTVTPIADGPVLVDIAAGVANDTAGNPNAAAPTFRITFDSIAPSVTIDPVTSPTTIATQTLTGTMEAGATVTLSSATAAFGDITTPTATAWSVVATLAEGPNVITATATDAAGNKRTATATIVLDTVAPAITINPVTTPTTIATQTLTGTMEAGATVTLSSATAAFGDITTPTATAWSVVATLAEGPNVITATATDAAGNTGTATANIIFVPLIVAPVPDPVPADPVPDP